MLIIKIISSPFYEESRAKTDNLNVVVVIKIYMFWCCMKNDLNPIYNEYKKKKKRGLFVLFLYHR